MRTIILLIALSFNFFCCVFSSEIVFSQDFLKEKTIALPISDIFDGKCVSLGGSNILDDIIPKFENKPIMIEVFCVNKLDYDYSWECANLYAYKVSKCLIEKGVNPLKLRYIAYGNLDTESKEQQNIIKITVQEVETLLLSN